MSSRFIQPFFDAGAGITPADGAQLFFFALDQVTPKDTYSDQLSTPTANSNPVIADANGLFGDIFITGTYYVVLKDKNDVQKWVGDPVTEAAEVTGANFDKNFATLALAVADTGLVDGDSINLKERTTGNGGGAMWDVVLSSTVTENTFNIVQCTGVGTLSLELRVSSISDARAFGYLADGTNMSAIVNNAMPVAAAAGVQLIVPPGTAVFDTEVSITSDNSAGDVSNLKLALMPGCIWQAGTTFSDSVFVRIKSVSEVSIIGYGAEIDGNFLNHADFSGVGAQTQDLAWAGANMSTGARHFNMAFASGTSDNVSIKGLTLTDAGQDNLYVAGCTNCSIEDMIMRGSVRNNESVINATNFTSTNCIYEGARQWWTDDFGYGVDLEPVSTGDALNNIRHISPVFKKNWDGGYRVGPGGALTNYVSTACINPIDIDSGWDWTTSARGTQVADSYELSSFNNAGAAVHSISLVNPKSFRANGSGIALLRYPGDLGTITVTSPEVYDWNQLDGSSSANQNAIGFANMTSGTPTLELHVIGTPVIKRTTETSGETAINGSLRGKSANVNWSNFWIAEPQVTGITTANIYGVNNNANTQLMEGHVDPHTCAFQVYLSGTEAITTATDTVIAWTTSVEDLDVNKSFASGVYTVPMDGIYEFHLEVTFDNLLADDACEAHIKVGGSNRKKSRSVNGSATSDYTVMTTYMASLAQGDTVQAACRQESGGNLNLVAGSARFTTFSGKRLS